MGLTELGASRAIRTAEVIYGPRKGDRSELVSAWRKLLAGFDDETVARAVQAYCESDASYFPTPGKIKPLARELRPPKRVAQPSDHDGPCAICGATLNLGAYVDGKDKRLAVMHNAEAHRRAGSDSYVGLTDDDVLMYKRAAEERARRSRGRTPDDYEAVERAAIEEDA